MVVNGFLEYERAARAKPGEIPGVRDINVQIKVVTLWKFLELIRLEHMT